jgi:hypothetical protein
MEPGSVVTILVLAEAGQSIKSAVDDKGDVSVNEDDERVVACMGEA